MRVLIRHLLRLLLLLILLHLLLLLQLLALAAALQVASEHARRVQHKGVEEHIRLAQELEHGDLVYDFLVEGHIQSQQVEVKLHVVQKME